MYALVALGYTMVYGIINLINFAHGEVLMVGALTSWTVVGLLQEHVPGMPGWLVLLISLMVACTVAAALNFAIEKIAYRPLRGAPKLAPLITAIGMSILLQTLAMIIWKPNHKAFPTLLPADPIDIGGAVITPTQIMILGVTAISLAVLMWVVNGTRLGRAMRATAENPRVATLMGVRPDTIISATFIIGAPMMKVAEMMVSGRTPIKVATRGFSAVARMARPKRVPLTTHISTASEMAVTPKIMICVGVMTAPPMSMGSAGSKVGKALWLGFQMIMAKVCNKMDMPMAVMRGANLGAPRKGR